MIAVYGQMILCKKYCYKTIFLLKYGLAVKNCEGSLSNGVVVRASAL